MISKDKSQIIKHRVYFV